MCVALHSLPVSTGCRVSSQNTRGSQCTCVPFSNQKVVTEHYTYVRTYTCTNGMPYVLRNDYCHVMFCHTFLIQHMCTCTCALCTTYCNPAVYRDVFYADNAHEFPRCT